MEIAAPLLQINIKADISEKISSMASENNKETNTYFDWRSTEQKRKIPVAEVQAPIKAVKKYLTDIILKEYQEYWK